MIVKITKGDNNLNTIDRYGYYAEGDTLYITHIGLFDKYMGVDEDMLPYINGVLSDGPHEDYYVGIADSTDGEPHVDGYTPPLKATFTVNNTKFCVAIVISVKNGDLEESFMQRFPTLLITYRDNLTKLLKKTGATKIELTYNWIY